MPAAKVAPLTSVPLLPPEISLAFPSPGHQLTRFAGGGVQTGGVVDTTSRTLENSDVLPTESVVVADMNLPAGTLNGNTTLKLALHEAFVATLITPRKVCPSPKPDESAASFENSSISKLLLALLLRVPSMVVLAPSVSAFARTGTF